MTAKKRAEATPPRYDEAFRREAIRLWKSSGKSAEIAARELGISVFQLYDWNREAGVSRVAGSARLPHLKTTSKEQLQDEVERLQRELARMTEQRDILKKRRASFPHCRRAIHPDFTMDSSCLHARGESSTARKTIYAGKP